MYFQLTCKAQILIYCDPFLVLVCVDLCLQGRDNSWFTRHIQTSYDYLPFHDHHITSR